MNNLVPRANTITSALSRQQFRPRLLFFSERFVAGHKSINFLFPRTFPIANRSSSSSPAKKMTTPLPHLPSITRLSPLITRILGANPSKYTLQGSNTYLIGSGSSRILLDTGEGKPEWKDLLTKVLRQEGVKLQCVVLSHWHGDHVGGVADVKDLCGGDGKVEFFKHRLPSDDEGNGYLDYPDGHVFKTEGATLRALHTPGHTADHMTFILEEEKCMFTMDNVLGHGTAVFEDLSAYVSSLQRMETVWKEEGLGRAYPGHGELIEEGGKKVREYIEHREGREREVIEVLKSGDGAWTSMEIVKVVYKAYPESLHVPAEGGVKQVLKKLDGEGRVAKEGERWRVREEGGGSKAAL
jgi:glyoxylase-like metal-dependent hydrolase (beta-lactamase superfamily II)